MAENNIPDNVATAAAHTEGAEIPVEVAYARPDVQVIIPLSVQQGGTLEDAIRQSGILDTFTEIDLNVNKVSVFGKLAKLTNPIRSGDRVEINRPLIADPKQVRKQRAERDSKGSNP
ncbi:MAG: RnfH family protein [Gammaproteobacteria bacterium]